MSGFKESAGTMTLYFKMNRYLRMMLQHGLFHLHIIVIVLEEEVVEVVVKTNEKVVAEAEVVVRMNAEVVAEAVAEAVAEVVVRTNEMLVAEVVAEVVAEAVLLIKTKKEVAEVVEIVD
jgi:uncharacterized protein (AIM24 family)